MNKLLTLLCVLAILSCKNSEKKGSSESTETETTKAKTSKASNKLSNKVTFSVKLVNPYCGGAAPSEEMENNRMKGESAKQFVFYVNSEGGSPQRVVTDMEGSATIDLANGSYCLKEGYKSAPEMIKNLNDSDWEFDKECFIQWKEQCNHTFAVSDTSSNQVSFTYYPRCGWEGPVPCITNAGFPPP